MAPRQAGDPLPKELIKKLRLRRGLSPSELAERLGMKGGAGLIVQWEEGSAVCEGPVAEFLLHLLGGIEELQSRGSLFDLAETIWQRSGNWIEIWRQIAFIPEQTIQIERTSFVRLFPGVEIPPEQHTHGFPFLDHGLPHEVLNFNGEVWRGVIPPETHAPGFMWLLDRNARFLYREKIWEDEKGSVTEGHIHIGSLLEITASAIFFLKRLSQQANLPASLIFRLILDQNGMANRGIVSNKLWTPVYAQVVDKPQKFSNQNHITTEVTTKLSHILQNPLSAVYDLVGEAALVLRPDLATNAALENQLRLRHHHDDRPGHIRFLGYLDNLLGSPRRGIVSLGNRKVGILEETTWGSRFTYDPTYLSSVGARPISPTLPLRKDPYESRGLLPFFANLLPEGTQLDLIAQQHKIERGDAFGLLLATGTDTIGAVEIRSMERQ